ncbi:hypothetical protein AGOR_G00034920 [Albula goreensis]|uniref:Extracellular matrix protein 1-like n=1 Tax=Albula goreensis TaxID=1534307 RepID=A0A8T3E4B6_9TELE|nr:hypothetical protein AGOR_G00034920 [Albula goreensis]
MDLMGSLRGSWVVALLLFCCVPAEGNPLAPTAPHVPFPPGRPHSSNLNSICTHGPHRPRYPKDSLPTNFFSYIHRQVDAINRLEESYQVCCKVYTPQNTDSTLSCVSKAWLDALTLYCEDEFSVKTKVYECCGYEGEAMWSCFARRAPNPSYLHPPPKQ